MPEVKFNQSNDETTQLLYKCFLLNVRSHRDYVCLEVDNCPSGLDFPISDEFSLDSSQIIIPVLDKIRFNIKSANPSIPHWFENKLEVFAEGHRIFPKLYCPKCERLRREGTKEYKNVTKKDVKSVIINNNNNNKIDVGSTSLKDNNDQTNHTFGSPCSSVNDLTTADLDKDIGEIKIDSLKCLKDISTDNVLIKQLFLKDKFKSKSEFLAVDSYKRSPEITSFSLPDVLVNKENTEKSVQTRVCLGIKDFSEELNLNDCNLTVSKSWDDISKTLNSKFRTANVDDDTKFIRSTTERFRSLDTNKKIRYWSLINSARQLMKMNQDVIELNSILKSLAVEKSLENNNLIGSLSPVNLILKLKNLNRSSNLYNMMTDITDRKQWYETKTNDKFGYFNQLNNTFSEEGIGIKQINNLINEKLKQDDGTKNDSLISMDTLFSIQRRMLKMMESFLRRNSLEQNSLIDVTYRAQSETNDLEN